MAKLHNLTMNNDNNHYFVIVQKYNVYLYNVYFIYTMIFIKNKIYISIHCKLVVR